MATKPDQHGAGNPPGAAAEVVQALGDQREGDPAERNIEGLHQGAGEVESGAPQGEPDRDLQGQQDGGGQQQALAIATAARV